MAVAEIKLGDNDNLAATLTNLLGVDLLINLTNVNGVMDADPRKDPLAKRIPLVEKVTPKLLKAASSLPGSVGRGGVLSKVKAADKAGRCGAHTIVADGTRAGVIDELCAGQDLGTLFLPRSERLTRRKAWIAFDSEAVGELVVDEGAVRPCARAARACWPPASARCAATSWAARRFAWWGPARWSSGWGSPTIPPRSWRPSRACAPRK